MDKQRKTVIKIQHKITINNIVQFKVYKPQLSYKLSTFFKITAVPRTADICIQRNTWGMPNLSKLGFKFLDTTPNAPTTKGIIVVFT